MRFSSILFSSFFLLFSSTACSQSVIKAGLIVNEGGDTLFGEVKSRSWHITPISLFFKQSEGNEFSEYSAGTIKYFEAEHDRYISANVWIDHRPTEFEADPDNILPEHSSEMEKKLVFLKILVLGSRYDLLELVDANKKHYYLRDINGIFLPLSYKVYSDNSGNIVRTSPYKQTLRAINQAGSNDSSINLAIMKAEYDASFLVPIIESLNNTTEKVLYISPEKTRIKGISFFIGPAAGITIPNGRGSSAKFISPKIGYIAGFVAGFDLVIGHSQHGSELYCRFNLMGSILNYKADYSNGDDIRKYHYVQHNLVPGLILRIPVVDAGNFQTHLGAGLNCPIVFKTSEFINDKKHNNPIEDFPWVGMMPNVQIDARINSKFEIGATASIAPLVEFGSQIADPAHYYAWVAYHF